MRDYVLSKYKSHAAQNNPFVEPVSIYSNIKNGNGLITGGTVYKKSFDLAPLYENLYTYEY